MDADRFDVLARTLAATPSRRWVSRALAGLSLGGGLSSLLGLAAAEAKKKGKGKKKKKCKGNKKKCGKKCIPKTNCCSSADCGSGGATCQGGTCLCPDGEQDCQGTCIADDACCPACGGEQTCQGGTCACPDETFPCGAECVTGNQCCDDADCGSDTCDDGFCGACPAGSISCDDDCCDVGADEVCAISPSSQVCEGGGCPPSNYCVDQDYFQCGPGGCACITSVEDANACTDLANVDCAECTSDAECTTALGQDALCIPNGQFCTNCPGTTNFCVATGCPSGGGGGSCPETDFCIDPETFTCGGSCVCTNTVGPMTEHACVVNPLSNPPACAVCASNADCDPDEACIASGSFCGEECGAAFCVPRCGEGALSAAGRRGSPSRKDAGAAKTSGGKRRDRQRGDRRRGGHKRGGRKQRR